MSEPKLPAQAEALAEKFVNPCMKDLLAHKEQIIREVVNELIPGWTLTDIQKRLSIIVLASDPLQRETLCLDGKPIMEFYPLETSRHDEGDKFVFRVTQQYRRLP
jgi:hypothetical protein